CSAGPLCPPVRRRTAAAASAVRSWHILRDRYLHRTAIALIILTGFRPRCNGAFTMMRILPFLLLLGFASSVRGELVALDILKREPFAGGKEFGATGAYEKIVAVAKFAVDPKNARNRLIVDLDHAPRNKDGKVEFE